MKAKVDAAAFLDALTRIRPATDAKPVVPMYSHVMIAAGGGFLHLETFDGHLAARFKMDATVEAAGDLLADLDLIRKWLKAVEGEVELIFDGSKLKLRGKRPKPRRLALDTLPALDWPEQSFEGGECLGDLKDLGPVIGRLATAAATVKDARDYLRGVGVGAEGWVATDGNRMHWVERPAKEVCIFPREYCLIIAEAAEGGVGQLYASPNDWRLEAGPLKIRGPVTYGTYPDWRKIVQAEETHVAFTAYRDDMIDAIRVAALGSRSAVIMEMKPGENEGEYQLSVESVGKADGKVGFNGVSASVCDAFDVERPKFRAAVHSPLMIAALEALTVDQVVIEISDGNTPRVRVRAAGGSDLDDMQALVMGMRY